MTDCPNVEIRELLPEYLSGTLSAHRRSEVETHLAGCEDCAEELALLRLVREAYAEATPMVNVDAATEYTALDGLIASEAKRKVWGAVGKLSPTQREVFLLRVNEGLSYKEIAEVAGTTEGAARVHYHNALRTVKENLNE